MYFSVKFDFEKGAFPFPVCEKMSDVFMKYRNKAIKGFNSGVNDTYYDTEHKCEDACKHNPQCLSFETWEKDGQIGCTTGSVTYDMIMTTIPTKIDNRSGTHLSSRTCIKMN